jgi:hypothetical protein
MVFSLFFINDKRMIEGAGSGAGSGSILPTSRSGSGRPKNTGLDSDTAIQISANFSTFPILYCFQDICSNANPSTHTPLRAECGSKNDTNRDDRPSLQGRRRRTCLMERYTHTLDANMFNGKVYSYSRCEIKPYVPACSRIIFAKLKTTEMSTMGMYGTGSL